MEQENTNVETQNEGQEEVKTYTQEEVNALLQQEGDRRVTMALKKEAEKNKAKLKEAEKLARMNEQEKYEYELQQREQAILEKEKALALAENKNEASKILAEKGLSLQLVDFVVAEDAETMASNINLLDQAFKASVRAEVEKRLASKTPKQNLPLNQSLTKSDLSKMSYQERVELKQNNPDVYNSLKD